ncbi:GroS Co-chaperonin GroES (HSP10) [uncultured Caudovirales phage]|uniref:GroS Co-chaperonin GroES (HSP10) n=1 Tax=uncultured Caudovirales phage TaxID=2100421 RepID=A0A6J5LDT4_9CAUD|nr:GroS Co-chaperonin GroES (HSP10) [uncultured Caudovirales phage]
MIETVLHRILVKADKLEETDKTYVKAKQLGLHIPEMDDRKRAQAGVDKGTVVSIGPTAFRDFGAESPIKVGDYIAYARFAGKILTDPATEEDFVILNDEDIVCIFKD